jgi:Domain of unknown function (DUF4382)
MKMQTVAVCLTSALLLTACGGGGGGSSTGSPDVVPGTLSVAISDSPMTGVQSVHLVLDEMVMTDAQGAQHSYPMEGVAFDLLDYRGTDSFVVISGMELAPGDYHNAHLTVRQQDGNQGSWVDNFQGRFDLLVDDTGLPMQDFTIASNQHLSMTMEIDLYLSMSFDGEAFRLHHNGIYSIDNRRMGHLLGEVDPLWISGCEVKYAQMSPQGEQFMHMAYLYPDNVTSLAQMGDIGQNRADTRIPPIAVAPIVQDMQGNWSFEMGYVAEGNYQLGYSCLGNLDNPQMDDTNLGQFAMYQYGGMATIDPGANGGHQTHQQFAGDHGGGPSGMMH